MTHFVRDETLLNTAHVFLAAEVDVGSLEFTEQEEREVASLEFLMVTISRKTGEFHRYDQTMDLKLRPETREVLSKTWLPIVRDFELISGDYRGKLVVRDKTSGRISTVIHDFEVPRDRALPGLDPGAQRHARDGRPGAAGESPGDHGPAGVLARRRRCTASSTSTAR